MENRIKLVSNFGFTLIQVNDVDENGNGLSTSYEVIDPYGNVLERFGILEEVKYFFKTVLPSKPKRSRPRPRGPGM
jgi:hypothetical protein